MASLHSHGFDEELINEYLYAELDEGPLLDRKRDLWKVGDKPSKLPEKQSKDRGKFIKHVIAMANSARRRGQETYILFGIDDEGIWCSEIEGVLGAACQTLSGDPIAVKEWNTLLDDPEKFSRLQMHIHNVFREMAERYIEPRPTLDYEWGHIFYKGQTGFLSYLRIGKTSGECFRVVENPSENVEKELEQIRRSHRSSKQIKAGACFTREGDNSVFIRDCSTLISYRDIPFIHKQKWSNYQEQVRFGLERRIPDYSWTIYVRDSRGSYYFNRYVMDWLERHDKSRVLMLEGPAGIGKTVSLCEWSSELLDILAEELEATEPGAVPGSYIPVYVPLRGAGDPEHLREKLAAALNWDGVLSDNPDEIIKVFHDKALKFVVMLDGVDEMSAGDNRLSILSHVMQSYPVRYIITSRPGWLKSHSELWDRLNPRSAHLERLRSNVVHTELGTLDIAEKIDQPWNRDMMKILHIPLYLECIRNQIEEFQILGWVSLGWMLDTLVTRLFEHSSKSLSNDRQIKRYRRYLRKIAWLMVKNGTYSIGYEQAEEICDEKAVDWMLEVGFLREDDTAVDMLEFSTKVFLWYWAAREILNLLQQESKTIESQFTQEIIEFEGIFRVAMSLYKGDFTVTQLLHFVHELPYTWALLTLLGREFQDISKTSEFYPEIQKAVRREDILLLEGLLDDPLLEIRLMTVQAILARHRSDTIKQLLNEKYQDWTIKLEEAYGDYDRTLYELVETSALCLDSALVYFPGVHYK
jgi:hypothetical protein